MNNYLLIAIFIGAVIGIGLASIPFLRRLREDRRILQMVKEGAITHNEARAMRAGTSTEQARLNEGRCPDCGGQLLAGPRAGMAINCACNSCHQEFNLGDIPGGRIIMERMGKLSAGRARYYGINPEELSDVKST